MITTRSSRGKKISNDPSPRQLSPETAAGPKRKSPSSTAEEKDSKKQKTIEEPLNGDAPESDELETRQKENEERAEESTKLQRKVLPQLPLKELPSAKGYTSSTAAASISTNRPVSTTSPAATSFSILSSTELNSMTAPSAMRVTPDDSPYLRNSSLKATRIGSWCSSKRPVFRSIEGKFHCSERVRDQDCGN
jgi:hypothetical protein